MIQLKFFNLKYHKINSFHKDTNINNYNNKAILFIKFNNTQKIAEMHS